MPESVTAWPQPGYSPRLPAPTPRTSGTCWTGSSTWCALTASGGTYRSRSLGIGRRLPRVRPIEQDEGQGVAGLGHGVAAQPRDLPGHATRVFRDHLAEAIALDRHLLPHLD